MAICNEKLKNRVSGIPFRFVIALVLIILVSPVFAQRPTQIRLASPVPENTPWGQYLNQIAADWRRITNGQVELIVFHNGVAGTEKDVLQKLRVNQLQAAVLSSYGLYELNPAVMTLSCPFLIRNDEELDLVMKELKDELESMITRQGYFTLGWARVGWVKFFSKAPVFVPADLKRQRLGTNADQEELNRVFRSMGFQMVSVARNDILVALNSNMADAVFLSPVAVGGLQIFGLARNMASINIAPFLGSVVIRQRTWDSIPANFKTQMIDAVRRREAELDRSVKNMEAEMIRTMGNHGLVVNQLTRAQEQQWYDEIGRAMPTLFGTVYDRATYTRIERMLTNFRNNRR